MGVRPAARPEPRRLHLAAQAVVVALATIAADEALRDAAVGASAARPAQVRRTPHPLGPTGQLPQVTGTL